MIIYSNFTPKTRAHFTEFFTPTSYFRPRKNALQKSIGLITNILHKAKPDTARGRVGRGIAFSAHNLLGSVMRISVSPFAQQGYVETVVKPEQRNNNLRMNDMPPMKVVNRHIAFLDLNNEPRLRSNLDLHQCYVNFMTCYGLYGKGAAYNLKMFYDRYNEVSDDRWLKFIELYVANAEQFQAFLDSKYYQLHTQYAPLVKGDKLFHSFSTLLFAFHMWTNHISVSRQGDARRMIVVNTCDHAPKEDDDIWTDSSSPVVKMKLRRAESKKLPVVLLTEPLLPLVEATNNIIFDESYLPDVCKHPEVARSFIIECFAFYKPNATFNFATYAAEV